ncbi:MAG: sigma-54-dependent Fis family transcriptional regulator [Pirellulales bacterium]|nr:sigma-54-dependent Fis family transcriptional regulator [Pirellulales bacterium]
MAESTAVWSPPQEPSALPESLRTDPARLAAVVRFWQLATQLDAERFWGAALDELAAALPADYVALAAASAGRWHVAHQSGRSRPLPTDLLADCLDADQPRGRSGWVAAPIAARSTSPRVVVANLPGREPLREGLARLVALAGILNDASGAQRSLDALRRRLDRLEAVMQITARWYQAQDTEELLKEMAQAATRLLRADRASIFLWDRRAKSLVARPALGVAGGELRIPDDTGIVGQVIHTGETRRVDLHADQGEIDRQVDTRLRYETKTLLCVPLRGREGEVIGAFEMINKLVGNFTDEDEAALLELAAHASTALENTQERAELLKSRQQLTDRAAEQVRLVGASPAIEALRSTIGRVASTDLAVLILGENGTGKEVVSQSIHYLSQRRERPLIAVNCAAISETLIESELFGHEKGAFTDARESRAGKFELASGGTLFLDEIGDLSLAGQAKLLRVLEDKIVVRVGGSQAIPTDTRVIAATNQDLAAMVRAKKFREDLYFRLNVVTLVLPPLRDRADDVLLLAEHFLGEFCARARRRPLRFSPEARRRMQQHTWPGNVRELRNLMERLAFLLPGERIEADDLAFALAPAGDQPPLVAGDLTLSEATDKFQSEYIRKAIGRARGNMSDAAEQLGLHRSNLYRKMRLLGMEEKSR